MFFKEVHNLKLKLEIKQKLRCTCVRIKKNATNLKRVTACGASAYI